VGKVFGIIYDTMDLVWQYQVNKKKKSLIALAGTDAAGFAKISNMKELRGTGSIGFNCKGEI